MQGLHKLAAEQQQGDPYWDLLGEFRNAHDMVGDGLNGHMQRAAQYLLDKAPKDPGTVQRMGRTAWKPDSLAIRRWSRYVQAVQNPMSAVEGVMNGTITPQAAEALRDMYPATFQRIQQQVWENADEIRANSSYDQRIRLSVLMGVPLEPSAQRSSVQFVQQQFAEREAAQQAPSGPRPGPAKPEPTTKAQRLIGR
jgi:hypothetical protein